MLRKARAGGQERPNACNSDLTTGVWGQLLGLLSLPRAMCVHPLGTKEQVGRSLQLSPRPGDIP